MPRHDRVLRRRLPPEAAMELTTTTTTAAAEEEAAAAEEEVGAELAMERRRVRSLSPPGRRAPSAS